MKFTVQKKTMENLKENSISINITGYEHKRPYWFITDVRYKKFTLSFIYRFL